MSSEQASQQGKNVNVPEKSAASSESLRQANEGNANLSVLISLYWRVEPQWLDECLESIINQTYMPQEVVLVVDGPVSADLSRVIKAYAKRFASRNVRFRSINLPVNMGLGRALSVGLAHCRNELVVRMDADDIMMPERLEKQRNYMIEHPEVTVCSAWIDEFNLVDGCREVVSTRRVPETHEEIESFAHKRCPINHPAAIFRKSRIEAAGGYEHIPLFEDYYLWAKLLVRGEKFHNLPESLLWFRQNRDVYRRRGGWGYILKEGRLQREMVRIGFLSAPDALRNFFVRMGVRVLPIALRRAFYMKFLR